MKWKKISPEYNYNSSSRSSCDTSLPEVAKRIYFHCCKYIFTFNKSQLEAAYEADVYLKELESGYPADLLRASVLERAFFSLSV